MKKIIHTEKAPSAIGTYNQAILTGNLLLTSGQIAINPLTGKLVDGDKASNRNDFKKYNGHIK